VDYHEMGKDSTYYFHPGVPTRTFPRVPKGAISLMYDYAEHPVEFMDRDAQLFFNEEGFDDFYIGKGSTFPLVNGSLGILYEAGRSEASEVNTINGLKTYRGNVRTHYRTSLSSIAAGESLRAKFLSYQKSFYKSALDLARKDRVKGYVFSSNGDKARMAHFIDVLTYHGIKVNAVKRNLQVGKATYRAGDAFVVDLNQRQYRLARSVFERITKFEDHIFYDVSTWTLPLSFDLDHDELTGSQFRAHLGGEVKAEFPTAKAPEKAALGYMFSWSEYYAPRALNRLLEAGVLAKVHTRPLRVKTTGGDVDLRRGSILIPVDKQTVSLDKIHAIMATIAAEDGVTIHSATSGWTPVGPQLGSRDSSRTVGKINPLLVVGDGVSPYDAGEVWHLLDYRMKMGVTLRDLNKLSGVTLADYTHLILPQGRYKALGEKMEVRIDAWVKAGGTLVAMGTGATYAEKTFLEREADQNLLPITPTDRATYADKGSDEALNIIGGAILGADMDVTHPIAFGFEDRDIPGHRRGTHILATPKNVYATVAKYNADPLLSGYVSKANRDRIGGSPMIVAERKGKGSIVLFADNPNFRGIWYGTNKLFLNALFFGKAFDAPRKVGDEAEAVEE
ncbi:MAG: peptidase, partial [Sphingomonadales bacterium]|nr:peptidase [Sphingomonadales bacterium]